MKITKEVFVFYDSKNKNYTVFAGESRHWTLQGNPLKWNEWSYLFKNTENRVKDARKDHSWIGVEITEFTDLPEAVRKFIVQILETI